jgi:K(+)-stimulated pyrophosphate-energized sodium pump
MAMKAVGEAAMEMIEEVRRQFREIEGLLEGTAKPDTARCVDISTKAAIRQMMLPGAMAIITPVAFGFWDAYALGGLLAGVTVSGVCMAIFMSNAGGAWDNAKKSFEGDGVPMPDGSMLTKGTAAHDAAVVGDTVGDPFKDTADPSLNILVKLMCVVALVIAPLIAIDVSAAPVSETVAIEETLAEEAPVVETVASEANAVPSEEAVVEGEAGASGEGEDIVASEGEAVTGEAAVE